MNMYSHGVDPKLDFSDMPAICEVYERVTRMHVYERTPYAGSLVFAAFSGSHQDAIAKGMNWRKEKGLHQWNVPYIPIDPTDIGRTYDGDVIRINSQSGKGGIGFLLQQNYGYNPPPRMREDLGYRVKDVSDHEHRELSVKEVLYVFERAYLNHTSPLNVTEAHFIQNPDNTITANVTLSCNGEIKTCQATGNGRLEDMEAAWKILKGHHIAKGVRAIIIPATMAVYKECILRGYTTDFIDAGCIVSTPTCGPCLGGYMGILAEGERCVSTTNRNFVGRMGHVDSEVYLASPATAAASALTGHITDPREV